LTFTVRQDTSATATAGVKAITDAAVVIGTDDDNKWASIEVQCNKLDIANGYRYVSLYATGGAGSNDYAAIVFIGHRAGEAPVVQSASYLTPVVVAG
jgi:hypothetical protein